MTDSHSLIVARNYAAVGLVWFTTALMYAVICG